MTINKQIIYNTAQAKYVGFIDYSDITSELSENIASEALLSEVSWS